MEGHEKKTELDIEKFGSHEAYKRRESYISYINNYLDRYLKDNDTVSIIVSIVLLFKCQKYKMMEKTELTNSLLKDYSKNKELYLFTAENQKKEGKELFDDFLKKVDSEIKCNNNIFHLYKTGEKKFIQLNLFNLHNYFKNLKKEYNINCNKEIKEKKTEIKTENKDVMKQNFIIENSIKFKEENTTKLIYEPNKKTNKSLLNKKQKRDDINIEFEAYRTKSVPKIKKKDKLKAKIINSGICSVKKERRQIRSLCRPIEIKEDTDEIEEEKSIKEIIKSINNNKKVINTKIKEEKKNNDSDIFSVKLYNVDLSKKKEDIVYEGIPKKIHEYLEKINKTKGELYNIETKIKYINNKILELTYNKKYYEKNKHIVMELKTNLNYMNNIIKNEIESLKLYTRLKDYDKNIYDNHKNIIKSYHENYLKILNKMRQNVSELKKLETIIDQNEMDIETNLENINSLNKEIMNNYINFSLLDNSKKNFVNEILANKEDILNEYLMESIKVDEELKKIENDRCSIVNKDNKNKLDNQKQLIEGQNNITEINKIK